MYWIVPCTRLTNSDNSTKIADALITFITVIIRFFCPRAEMSLNIDD